MTQYKLNKKETFSELRDYIWLKSSDKQDFSLISDVKLSFFNNQLLIDTIKTLKVIELDNLESYLSYIKWDHFLVFKFDNDYYFCDTELVPALGSSSILKIIDYKQHLRKDKINKISNS